MTLPEHGQFAPLVGELFSVLAADASAEMTLTTAQPLPAAAAAGQTRAPFELEFHGPVHWPQGTYRFGHPTLGDVDIFVVPIAGDEAGTTYHALFN